MTSAQIGNRVAFRVVGRPIPQGSKVANYHGHGVRDANDKVLRPWRATVKTAAEDVWRYRDTITAPVRVWLRFGIERPTSHYGTGRNAHRLKDSAPQFPFGGTYGGDLDKLERAILDGLTDAGVWRDDALVVDLRARKFYAGEHELAPPVPGVDIILEEIAP